MNSIKEMQRFKELYQRFRFLAENDDNFTFINNNNSNDNDNANKNNNNNNLSDNEYKGGYIKRIKPIEKNFEKYNSKVYQFNDD
jgi:hypothetical protein